MLANKAFINPMIKIMANGKSKAKVVSFFNIDTFSFIYDVRTTIPGQFSNRKLFYVDNFQANTSVVMEVQISSRNLKSKRFDEFTHGYSFKLVRIYKI